MRRVTYQRGPTRRQFFSRIMAGIGGLIGVSLGIPLAGFGVLPALKEEETEWARLGPVEMFVTGQPKLVPLAYKATKPWPDEPVRQAVYVLKKGENDFVVYQYIMKAVPFGPFVRGLHRWGASLIVVVAVLHLLRVFFFGAYKYPREFNWVIGVLMLLLIFGLGFTGYLLPWDNRAYWATVVGTHIVHSWPVVGDLARRVLEVGADVGIRTLTRFYNLHAFILPAALGWLILVHFYLVVRQGIAAPPHRWKRRPRDPREAYREEVEEKQRSGLPFYEALWKDAVVALVLFAILAGMALFLEIPTEKVADPSDVNYVPRPEWYFLFLYELLWYFKGKWMVVGTFVIPAALFLGLILLPFVDRGPERHPMQRPLASTLAAGGLAAAVFLTYLGAAAPLPPGPTAASVTAGGTAIMVAATPEAGRLIYVSYSREVRTL